MNLTTLDPFSGESLLRVVVETPKGSRNKLDYDPELEAFRLKKTLPAGMAFPYDFGFIPRTLGEDGDPLDVLLLMPESLPPGAVVDGRLIGVIRARQSEKKGKSIRNDRFLVVSETAEDFSRLKSPDDLPATWLEELEEFFITYNRLEGRKFELLDVKGAKAARKLIRAAFCDL